MPPLEALAKVANDQQLAAAKVVEEKKSAVKPFAKKLAVAEAKLQQAIAGQLDAEKLLAAKSQVIEESLGKLPALRTANAAADQLAAIQAKVSQIAAERKAAPKRRRRNPGRRNPPLINWQRPAGSTIKSSPWRLKPKSDWPRKRGLAAQAQAAVAAAKDLVDKAAAEKLAFDAAYNAKP